MFEYIKSTYKVGDRILVQCSMGDIKGEIIYLGEDSIGILSDDNKKRHILKGADISYCEDCEAITESNNTESIIDGHGYVDLGLRSGTLWATCNVGANEPWEYGDYFAWGETESKKDYSSKNYKWSKGSCDTKTKYYRDGGFGIGDGLTILLPEDDAATANWGAGWRMPTGSEQEELKKECTWEWTDNFNGSGVAGLIGTSLANDNTIFFPAAGFRSGTDLFDAGNYGCYWSPDLFEYGSDCVLFYDFHYYPHYFKCDIGNRLVGRSVRAVIKQLKETI